MNCQTMLASSSGTSRAWIACGSYALLHALQAEDIDLLELENSTGVTFGIASYGGRFHCTRMLTPFRTFWHGVVSAAALWGIHFTFYRAQRSEELPYFLRLPEMRSLVLGPVNMMALRYLPLSSQYRCADHYVALRRVPDNFGLFRLIDSEGIPGMLIAAEDIPYLCDISNIPEAEGTYTIGAISREPVQNDLPARLRYTARTAEENYGMAEAAGQGGAAFQTCYGAMRDIAIERWREPLLYDLDYYIQRKEMLTEFVRILKETNTASVEASLWEHIYRQTVCAAHLRSLLQGRCAGGIGTQIESLAELESSFARLWKDWVHIL